MIAIRLGRSALVLVTDRLRRAVAIVLLGHARRAQVALERRVTAQTHLGLLLQAPRVHVERAHEGDVHAQITMHTRALEAKVGAVGQRGPQRIVGAAVDANLVASVLIKELLEEVERLCAVQRTWLVVDGP